MLIDTHCHLTDKKYHDIFALLDEAKATGIEKLITVGTSLKENKEVLDLADRFDNVYAVIGVYPHADLDSDATDIERELVNDIVHKSAKLVAIGECGIDFPETYNPSESRTLDKQIELFALQADIAIKNNLPIVIHNRNGDDHVLSVIKKFPGLRGVAHCFTQDLVFAEKMIDLGFYISFSGMLTYPKNIHLIEVAKAMPRNKIVLETDAPYLPPQTKRGSVNVPANITEVAAKLAEAWEVDVSEVCRITSENATKLFNFQ